MHRVPINEQELFFLELFRIALSAETLEDRLTAIRSVKHEVIAARLKNLSEGRSSGWQEDPANQDLMEWVAKTAGEREDAICEFWRVSRRYEDRIERRLNVAEHVGKMIGLSLQQGPMAALRREWTLAVLWHREDMETACRQDRSECNVERKTLEQ